MDKEQLLKKCGIYGHPKAEIAYDRAVRLADAEDIRLGDCGVMVSKDRYDEILTGELDWLANLLRD